MSSRPTHGRSPLRILVAFLLFAVAGWILWENVVARRLGSPPVVAQGLETADSGVRTAVEAALEQVRRDRRDLEARQRLCMVYQANGFVEAARDCWLQVLAVDDSQAHVWFYLAKTHERSGHVEDALDALARASELDPNFGPIAWHRALWALDTGRLEEAASALTSAIDLDPQNEAVWFAAVRLALARGEPERALELISTHRLLEGRNDPYARHLAAAAYRAMGRGEEAERVVAGAPHHTPSFDDPWTAMLGRYRAGESQLAGTATRLVQAGRYQEALQVLGQIQELDRSDPRLAALTAQCWLGLGDAAQAVAILQRAAEDSPDNPVLMTNLSVAALSAARTDAAQLELALGSAQRAVELAPESAQPRLALAAALAAGGRIDESTAEYRRAFAMDARDPAPLIRAAYRHLATSQPQAASELLELVADSHPERASVWAGLARAAAALGEDEEAAALRARAAEAPIQDVPAQALTEEAAAPGTVPP